MELYDYPGIEGHRKKHGKLVVQVVERRERLLAGDVPEKASFVHFFESWLVRHILDEDRKYGAFLNAKGVY
jgi:hemerythrin-like metal-binding protein